MTAQEAVAVCQIVGWQALLRQFNNALLNRVKATEKNQFSERRGRNSSRADMNRLYSEQTSREMSDYILVQQADKVVR